MTISIGASMDRAAIEAHQLGELRQLLGSLRDNNLFYSSRLRKTGASAEISSLREFAERTPFTLKANIVADQAMHPPYGSNLTFPLEYYTRFSQTSGTSGKPMRWLDTPESWDWMVDCWTSVFRSADACAQDRVFFPFSFGPFLGFWVAFEAASRMGCLAISGGGMRSVARLEAILDNEVTILCSTPSYAIRLAEVAHEEGIDVQSSKVRRILVAGEPGGSIPATRVLIEKLWPGARVVDHHGMTEIGPVSYECPVRPGVLHILESGFIPEVIDTDNPDPVAPGDTGELVLTNLGRRGSPLLRYRTGDIVRRSEAIVCACGSSEMGLEGGILARGDDMVIVRGVNLYPSAVEEILRSCGVAEFQVETYTERALTEMSIRIEPEIQCPDLGRFGERVASALQNALGFRLQVSCLPSGTLPRFEGKARRWIRR